MRNLILALTVLTVTAVSVLSQSPAAKGSPARPTWTLESRTPDGQPDLEGYWSNVTITPLERPAELAGKEFYTDEELAKVEEQAKHPRTVEQIGGTIAHYDFVQFGLDQTQAKHALNHRTSLVVDPADGRIPPMNEEGRNRNAERAAARKRMGPYDGPESRPLSERCIFMTQGPPMLPEAYNANLQIQQGPGYVAILQEEIHDIRIIALDGRPHIGKDIHQYMGDSRGHWEGNTLVVDTTNFNDKTAFRGSSENLRVIELFTRLDANTILYRFTVEDPHTWDRPWTAELPITKIDGPLFEFACHEGNYGMANTLKGARAAEKAGEDAAKQNAK